MRLNIFRNDHFYIIDEQELRRSDLILATDGLYRPASDFPMLSQRLAISGGGALEGFLQASAIALVAAGSVALLVEVLDSLWPSVNDVPLSSGTRMYVRERDSETCFYCGVRATDGHVDHRISRRNGGSNAFSNLAWACVSCNCSKGPLNDYEFIELLS